MDLIFYLKANPSRAEVSLPWRRRTKLVGLDPASFGIACEGADRLCSTAFSHLHQALRDGSGRVIPALARKYSGGEPVERVAFLGFSAAHGFLNPMLNNDEDRSLVSAVIMMDTCFGSGKSGFIKGLQAAYRGSMLMVWVTSHDGAPWAQASVLRSGTHCFQTQVLEPSGLSSKLKQVPPSPLVPAPVGGAYKIGELGYWLRYADNAAHVQIPHWKLGEIQRQVVEGYLLPYMNGQLAPSVLSGASPYLLLAAGAAGVLLARHLMR